MGSARLVDSVEPYRDVLWSDMEPIYHAILEHPFITGLTDGSLPREAFRHFVVQDAHYLRGYARALAGCAAKAPDENSIVMFAEHAAEALTAERELHAALMVDLGSSADAALKEPVAPTTCAYVSYLIASVLGGSYAEAVGAILPCYWIYAKVGEALLERGSPDPLYARWIAMYGSEDFKQVVEAVLDVVDDVGAAASSAELDRVREHVRTTSRYEWMFWDAGYRRESWPI
jgi:thiaminase/transcriptional activator TenA